MAEERKELTGEGREALLNRVEEKASFYLRKYAGCGQCSLLALQEEMSLPGGRAVIKAGGFMTLGIALMGKTCGALLAGMMAIGLACGRDHLEDTVYPQPEDVDDIYQLPNSLMRIRGFYYQFIREFGSADCRDLQVRLFGRSFETIIMEEEEKYNLAGGHLKCVELVGKAARLAAQAILDLPRR